MHYFFREIFLSKRFSLILKNFLPKKIVLNKKQFFWGRKISFQLKNIFYLSILFVLFKIFAVFRKKNKEKFVWNIFFYPKRFWVKENIWIKKIFWMNKYFFNWKIFFISDANFIFKFVKFSLCPERIKKIFFEINKLITV